MSFFEILVSVHSSSLFALMIYHLVQLGAAWRARFACIATHDSSADSSSSETISCILPLPLPLPLPSLHCFAAAAPATNGGCGGNGGLKTTICHRNHHLRFHHASVFNWSLLHLVRRICSRPSKFSMRRSDFSMPHHVALVVPLAVDNQSIVDIASWLKVF